MNHESERQSPAEGRRSRNDYALLIGVSDYAAYARSAGAGVKPDLPGSFHDVKVWWDFLCDVMKLRPANIRVLVSPSSAADVTSSTFPGAERVDAATGANITSGLTWLADLVGRGAVGLMTYSGHGAIDASNGFCLCPTDTTLGAGGVLANTLSFQALAAIVRERRATDDLTVVLDCCHSGRGTLEKVSRTLTPDAEVPAGARPAIAGRVLAACSANGIAYEARLDVRHRGAFSFCLDTALGVWKAVPDRGGDTMRSEGSYGHVMRMAHRLLESLEIGEKPELRPAGVAPLAFLQRGLVPESTSGKPDAKRPGTQLDPTFYVGGCPYLLVLNGNVIGQVFSANDASGYAAQTEYWSLNAERLMSTETSATTQLDIVAATPDAIQFPLEGATPVFSVSADVAPAGWSISDSFASAGQGVFFGTGDDGVVVALDLSDAPKSVTWWEAVPPSGDASSLAAVSYPFTSGSLSMSCQPPALVQGCTYYTVTQTASWPSWVTSSTLLDSSLSGGGASAMVAFDGYTFIACVDASANIQIYQNAMMSGALPWYNTGAISSASTHLAGNIAMLATASTMYMYYQAGTSSSNYTYWVSSSADGVKWTSPSSTNVSNVNGLVVTSLGGSVYMAYVDGNGAVWLRSSSDGLSFPNKQQVYRQVQGQSADLVAGAPYLALTNDGTNLRLAYLDSSDNLWAGVLSVTGQWTSDTASALEAEVTRISGTTYQGIQCLLSSSGKLWTYNASAYQWSSVTPDLPSGAVHWHLVTGANVLAYLYADASNNINAYYAR